MYTVYPLQMLELIVQKCIISANPDFTRPGDVFRRVMECVASGIFLPGTHGMSTCVVCQLNVYSLLSLSGARWYWPVRSL